MIERLEKAREWVSHFLVALVIVAAAKDHVFEALPTFGLSDEQANEPNTQPKDNTSSSDKRDITNKKSKHHNNAKLDTDITNKKPKHNNDVISVNRKQIVLTLYVISLIFIYAVLETATEFSISRVRFVRRVIMGGEDIEDGWLDIVFHSDEVIGGGFIRIYYHSDGYKIEGRDFTPNHIWTGWFTSELTRYRESCLLFKYRALRPGIKEDGTGHGEYNFAGDQSGHLTHYFGHFFEDRDNKRYYVYGERTSVYLPDRKLRKELLKPDKMAELVAKFMEDRKNVLPITDLAPEKRPPRLIV
jgi:hypothetical protein